MKKITIFLLLLFTMQISAFADELSCKIGMQDLIAIFTPKTINCGNNQFLPANSVVCSNCPNGYTCSGGDLLFNETKSSGIDYTQNITVSANNVCSENFPRMLYANFRVAQRNCNPGYYLPANIDECTACPAHGVCPGGTYTFNETTTQGITGCESGYNLQNNVCVGNIITINWSDADALDISANNAGTMTYGGDIRTPRTAIDKTNIGLRFKGWKFTPNPQ